MSEPQPGLPGSPGIAETNLTVAAVRNRAAHYLEPSIAASIGVSLHRLTQFASGFAELDEEQLRSLARRMKLI